jgi:hypothetical protein
VLSVASQGQSVTLPVTVTDTPVALLPLVVNLLVGLLLSFVLRWHFVRYGTTLGNRREFGVNFALVMLPTTFVISIVKHALALALGLVAAVSIVRYRTPIKEPEELGYLFVAIACGLGLGANQTVGTVVAFALILLVVTAMKRAAPRDDARSLYLTVAWPQVPGDEKALDRLAAIVGRHVANNDLRRFDAHDGRVDATFFVDVSPARLSALVDDLRHGCPGISVTFLDQSRMPAV